MFQNCISNNIAGEIAKQEITSCPPGRYTRGLHCQTIFVKQHQVVTQHHANRFQNVLSGRIEPYWYFVGGFVDGCRWFWMVLGGFGWFHVLVTTFKLYELIKIPNPYKSTIDNKSHLGGIENEALENEDRSTKHPETRKRSTLSRKRST